MRYKRNREGHKCTVTGRTHEPDSVSPLQKQIKKKKKNQVKPFMQKLSFSDLSRQLQDLLSLYVIEKVQHNFDKTKQDIKDLNETKYNFFPDITQVKL